MASCVSAFSERRRLGSERPPQVHVVHVEAHHLSQGMHARVGAAGARGLDVALEQQRQRLLYLALHRELAGLAGEPGKRRAVVGHGEPQRVVAHRRVAPQGRAPDGACRVLGGGRGRGARGLHRGSRAPCRDGLVFGLCHGFRSHRRYHKRKRFRREAEPPDFLTSFAKPLPAPRETCSQNPTGPPVNQRGSLWCRRFVGWRRRRVLRYASLWHRAKIRCHGFPQRRPRPAGR